MLEPHSDSHWQAFHKIDITTYPDGSALVVEETNDDNDDGMPDGVITRWETLWPDAQTAIRSKGKSRTGISGVVVNVTIDGRQH